MTQATINGNTYSDDGTSSKDMLNGGHRTHFIPMVGDVAAVAGVVATQAAQTAIDAANAANGALATKGTSTTSLAVSAGSKSITTQSGKQFTAGNFITISRTSAPTTLMHGVVTAYSGTALTVEVSTISGSGTYTDWTIALSGAQGAQGPSGNGVMPYAAKTSAYTVVTTDRGSLIDCTSGTFVLSFQGCATLGADWSCYIRNSGTGVITLDPSGAETIDGAATYTLNPGSMAIVQCDGSVLRAPLLTPKYLAKLPIFSADAATAAPVSVLEDISFGTKFATGLGAVAHNMAYGNALFIAAATAIASNVASSPDGEIWTLRAMPSAQTWRIASNGTNFIAAAQSSTATAVSTNGTTWTSGAALGATAGSSFPEYLSGTGLVYSATTVAYSTINNGTSWSAQTLPAAIGGQGGFFVVGGRFWYWANGTTAYWSTTGLTGSWTSVTLPISPARCWRNADGTLGICATGAGAQVYFSSDGATFTAASGIFTPNIGMHLYRINGVLASFYGTTFGASGTCHAGGFVPRNSTVNQSAGKSYSNGTNTVIPADFYVISISAVNSPNAIFTR